MITSFDWSGRKCVLMKDGKPVERGSTHIDFRGDKDVIVGGKAPHKQSSSGAVYTDNGAEYYPSVFDMKWERV